MSLPERWIQVCITDERSSSRFETFANRLVLKQAVLGLKVAGDRLTGWWTHEGRIRVRPDSSPTAY